MLRYAFKLDVVKNWNVAVTTAAATIATELNHYRIF